MSGIFAQLTALTGIGTEWFWTGVLVFLRVGSAVALMPAFGEQTIPARVRLAAALAFTAIVAPAVATTVRANGTALLLSAGNEVLAGLALGLGMRLYIMALQMAAVIIAQATSLSQLFGGATPEPQPAIGNLLTVASLALAVATGLHVKVASLLILSYDLLPTGHLPRAGDMAHWGLGQIAHAFALGFMLAAPFVIGSVIYNVALGIINRAMPQLMVTLVGAPVLTAGGLVLMAVTIPLILSFWVGGFDSFLAHPLAPAPP